MKIPSRAWTMLPVVFAAAALLSCGGGGGGGGSCELSGGTGTPGAYHIELRYQTALTQAQKDAFQAAATRIEGIVTTSPSSVSVTWDAGNLASCENPSESGTETIGGLVIFVSVKTLGSGILAESGPCLIRGSSHLPVAAILNFDSTALASLTTLDLGKTALHEMLHTLGFGTMWGPSTLNGFGWDLLSGAGKAGASFTGDQALCAAKAQNHAPASWSTVPVEDCVGHAAGTCGSGTQDSHWRQAVFGSELMTGWIVKGATQPLSATTVASLRDVGYTVDLSKADTYTIPVTAAAVSLEAAPSDLWLGDDVRRVPPLEVPEP